MAGVVKLRNIRRALTLKPSETINYILSGRIANLRPYKNFNFADLNDGSTVEVMQVLVKRSIRDKLELGSYITCKGNIVSSKGSKQKVEFKVDELQYYGDCEPFIITRCHNHMHLRPREPHFASLLRIKSELELSLHMIMKQMDFFKVHTPCLNSNSSEASSDLFVVNRTKASKPTVVHDDAMRTIHEGYFDKEVFLITSSQLHLENLAASLSRVYTLTNAFRAENSISTRHLCEFLMFEAEEANLIELEPLMNRVESIIKFVAQFLSEVSEYKSDFASLVEKNINSEIFNKLAHSPYIRMNYTEALRILKEKTDFSGEINYGADIGRIQERMLLSYCDNVPIFITNYPKQLKPFYMKCDKNNKEAECFDLIVPHGGEICGGSLREDCVERLTSNLAGFQANEFEKLNWYLDSRRFGSFPHGGFGIGVERLIQSMLGIKNIKDTTAFPRWVGHCPM